jgi:3-oxoacyl-[acyl-carrier protein] reductase
MDLGLAGRRALVTGSSSGIGAGIAGLLAAEGCEVIVHGRSRARAEAVAAEIGAVAVAIGDLASDAGADVVAAAAGEIDILVNNAGGSDGTAAKPWLEVDEAEWAATYQQNLIAGVRMIRRFLPAMQRRGWGRIIQIASAAATQPIPFGPDYGAAKAAMINMTVSLAKALGPSGVTANCVSPGIIRTPAVEQWIEGLRGAMGWPMKEEFAESERRLTEHVVPVPVGRIGRIEEIAHVVCMIASPNAGFLTGANIRVDGGQNQGVN